MTRKESLALTFMIWICVYPCVLLISYSFEWLGIDWPKWAVILVSTACTVPLIEFIVTPRVEKVVATARDDTRAELLADKAREADGPDPGPRPGDA